MCSLNDYDNCGSLDLCEKPIFSDDTNCRSCTNKGLVKLRKKDIYCKSCFLATETHKFRAALGKTKLMKPQDKVLVAYSGSQSSAALLHLLHSSVTEKRHKKLFFTVMVLFIEEGALSSIDVEERKKTVQKISNQVSVYNFPLFATSLSESFRELPILESSLIIDREYDKKLTNLFENVKSFSSKEDLLYLLKQKLILKCAEQLNCNKVFTAEVGTDIAIKLLNGFSLGRGATASFDSGFCDFRHPHIKVLRPLRDFIRKEIVFYNKFQNVEALNIPKLTTKLPTNASIQKLTEKFVIDLQEGFPSTVYTIFRTAEKLNPSTVDETVIDSICVLCKDKIRTSKNRSNHSAIEAAKFSRNISCKKLNNCSRKQDASCCEFSAEKKKDFEMNPVELEKCLCYGCALIIRDMKNVDVLPREILQTAAEENNFETMRKQISEFLIENSLESGA